MAHYELTSYTIHTSTVFSDGKVEHRASFLEDKTIIVCPQCLDVFWRNEALASELAYSENQEELPFSKSVLDLELARRGDYPVGLIHYYNELLERGIANNNEKEVYLRIILWQTINDLIRYQRPLLKSINYSVFRSPWKFIKGRFNTHRTFKRFLSIHYNNLARLSSVFNPDNDDDRLMKAEMYREMGDRSKSLEILNSIKNDNSAAQKKIKIAALLFKKRVFLLSH